MSELFVSLYEYKSENSLRSSLVLEESEEVGGGSALLTL